MRLGHLATACAAALLSTAASSAEIMSYRGVCEASAAAILDDTHFVVANDELTALTSFERGKPDSGRTLVELNDVTDLEGAARIGDRIFWLTSHSYNKDGVDKDKRKWLSVTAVGPGPSLTPAGTPFAGLRARVATLLHTDEWPLGASLNIEGLAATPEGDLLLGLRAPLMSGKAGVVRIRRPLALVGLEAPGATAAGEATDVRWLPLGGRGIRSIERVGTGSRAYLIVAGATGEGRSKPKLYWWDGASEVTDGPDVAVEAIAPEALIAWPDHSIQVIGDNEAACSDEKDKPEDRWFPSIEFRP